ncbi:bifunctional adenosylcobinamide kinase/adenosylcobinamide-phosphate guanylyltransferase [Mycolicibacterium sediminis]|uniref:Adenosylcobinamide kinase n=1 Tax=Mycolicibacterium sediminis TaxID=1286180 RepID=A0A7I7QX50_9MYCO|nr:bifunctional adenosylcobinamide kinase/adenosylcobinamide-phosphate guanylyltransferase [Mycolicibacterium sediminis]BBY30577.1 adenosylcobinamide kinase [Mycolicibacterium sediminis]
MRLLVLGGIRSGKSAFAEATIGEAAGAEQPVRYVATAALRPDDSDWSTRVAAHRLRRPPEWTTVEDQDLAMLLRADPTVPTLVDDVGNWLVWLLDRHEAWTGGPSTAVADDVDALLDAVAAFDAPLALVSPEVGSTVVPATASGRRFADALGTLNQQLAQRCDSVVLVVAGQPLTIKEPA